MERDHAIDRLLKADNVERLHVTGLVVSDADDPPELDQVVVRSGDRILKVALIDAVSFFGNDARYAVAKPSEAVAGKGGLVHVV